MVEQSKLGHPRFQSRIGARWRANRRPLGQRALPGDHERGASGPRISAPVGDVDGLGEQVDRERGVDHEAVNIDRSTVPHDRAVANARGSQRDLRTWDDVLGERGFSAGHLTAPPSA